ncbi:MAG: GntR family transcriptional regulator [Osedax symbiont Rs1]|nr:MAG: GntR family transcriptional regulator [Osedax symbiont Rs1]
MSTPRFIIIKNFIEDKINAGEFTPGDRVPSENELCQQFSVSRMTARRALQSLNDEGLLIRTPGLGSFVAKHRPISTLLEVRNIADEVHERGNSYSAKIITMTEVEATSQQAAMLNVAAGAILYHSVIVHFEEEIPVQWEDRLVNPALAADYLLQDFNTITPNAYLSKVAPLTEASHKIEATLVDQTIASKLHIDTRSPCLQISRRTWSAAGIVSIATLIHPGDRYCLGGHWKI